MNVKVIKNVPEEKRRKEQEQLEQECEEIVQREMNKTKEFLRELYRYETIGCPACGGVISLDKENNEQKVSAKRGFIKDTTVYYKTTQCPECKSILSYDERKERKWHFDGLKDRDLVFPFVTILVAGALIVAYALTTGQSILDVLRLL